MKTRINLPFTMALCLVQGLKILTMGAQDLYVLNEGPIRGSTVLEITPQRVRNIMGTDNDLNVYELAGMAFDASGDLYIVSATGEMFWKYDSQHLLTGVKTDTTLGLITCMAFDPSGNCYFGVISGEIYRYHPDNEGKFSFTGQVPYLFAQTILSPVAMAFDRDGNLFVANFLSSVEEFPPTGGEGDIVVNLSDYGLFDYLGGLTIDKDNNVYFSASSMLETVFKIDPQGELHTLTSKVPNPSGLAFDDEGNLFVSSYYRNEIYKLSPEGGNLTVFASASEGLDGPIILAFNTQSPAQQIHNLQKTVETLVASGASLPANGQSLQSKLKAALDALAAGDKADALGALQAFINQTKAFIKTRKLTAAQGQPLIDAANCILLELKG